MRNLAKAAWLPGMSRRELLFWLAGGVLAVHFLNTLDLTSPATLLLSLFSANLVYCFACFAVIQRLRQSNAAIAATAPETGLTLLGMLATVGVSLFANAYAIGIMSTLLSLVLICHYRSDPYLRTAGMILAAISVHVLWAPLLFVLLQPMLLVADAAAVSLWLSFLRPDITLQGQTFAAPGGHAIALIGACSSFHNISIAILAYVSVALLLRKQWLPADVLWLAAIVVIMVMFNVLRIGLVAWSREAYLYWHDGSGSQWLALLQTLVLFGVSFWGANAVRRSAA